MRKFTRAEAPDFLREEWEDWGKRYKNNRERNSSFKFQWPTHRKQRINQILVPLLANQTQDHCSYCDHFPVRNMEESIDHFKPKSASGFYELVCQWENLYYSCENCQGHKGGQYEADLLRPDTDGYSFDKYIQRTIYTFFMIGLENWIYLKLKKRHYWTSLIRYKSGPKPISFE